MVDAAAPLQPALDLSPNAGVDDALLAILRVLQGPGEHGLALAKAGSHDIFRNVAFAMIRHAPGNPTKSDAALQGIIDGFGRTAVDPKREYDNHETVARGPRKQKAQARPNPLLSSPASR